MRVAGVWIAGEMWWVDVGEHRLQSGDIVTVRSGPLRHEGRVHVCPQHMLQAPRETRGTIIEVGRETIEPEPIIASRLSDLPPMGTRVRTATGPGLVVGVDLLNREISVESEDRIVSQFRLDDIEKGWSSHD